METPPSRAPRPASVREEVPTGRGETDWTGRWASLRFDRNAAEPGGTPGECPGGGNPGRGEMRWRTTRATWNEKRRKRKREEPGAVPRTAPGAARETAYDRYPDRHD